MRHTTLGTALALTTLTLSSALVADTLPTGEQVAVGEVTVHTANPQTMNIIQHSDRAVVNWSSFSIGTNARVDIQQPSGQSAILNRVTGSATSQIYGQLTANGQVHIVNPNGIFIGPSGSVKAGGFVASTLGISNADFAAGKLRYSGNGSSKTVSNAGQIAINHGGYAALIGGKVRNSGTITVPLGRIGLASGERVTLDLSGDRFLQVALPTNDAGTDPLIENSGTLSADGGTIELQAATARETARQVINLSGVAEARSVGRRGGTIFLGGGGGTVRVSGRVNTRSARISPQAPSVSLRPHSRGGDITITGLNIDLIGSLIDASGDEGGGTIRIGGDFAGAGSMPWAQSVFADSKSFITSDAMTKGDGGRIVLWSALDTDVSGTLSARGGPEGGNGGFVEISSKGKVAYRGLTDTRAPLGSWGELLIDPTDITVPGTISEAVLEANLATGNFTLNTASGSADAGDITINADIDWFTGSTFQMIADRDIILNGALNGVNGNVILDAVRNVVVNAIAPISTTALTISATTASIYSDVVATGTAGFVSVDQFYQGAGSWTQIVPTLPSFNATNFISNFGSRFLRAEGGNGSTADPYQLGDVYGLQGVNSSSFTNTSFVLARDIDASPTANWVTYCCDADGFTPIQQAFSGDFDGAGHTIRGLYLDGFLPDDSSTYLDRALFMNIASTGVVHDLMMANTSSYTGSGGLLAYTNNGTIQAVSVQGTMTSYGADVGGLVAINNGVVTYSVADVAITHHMDSFYSTSFSAQVGGFVGRNTGTGYISRSNAQGSVTVDNQFSSVDLEIGGFVGANSGVISDSYALGDVSAASATGSGALIDIGGFAGDNLGSIQRVFSAGRVSTSGDASTYEGGLIGFDQTAGAGVSSSFWDSQTSGQATSDGGIALTTNTFQTTQSFLMTAGSYGWNFDTVWAPGDTGFYPVNYSTSPVIFARPNGLTVQYGLTGTTGTTGMTYGGTNSYVFGPLGDTLDANRVFDSLSYANANVGVRPFTLSAGSLGSARGLSYRVVDLPQLATITPAPLTITPNNQTKIVGRTFVFNGTEFTTSGFILPGASVSGVSLFSLGAPASASILGSPYGIYASGAVGVGLENYSISYDMGQLVIIPAPNIVPPLPTGTQFPNPADQIRLAIDDGRSRSGQVTSSSSQALQKAGETLDVLTGLSSRLDATVKACSQSSGDVGRYLACMSDALNDFSSELDDIAEDLPPEMRNVAQIVQTARGRIDRARARAESRLANATTDAEREAIRAEAINDARSGIQEAASEIRKAISLVRVEDPELASLQTQQIATIANAVDSVDISLSRAVGL